MVLRRANEMKTDIVSGLRDGKGEARITHILEGDKNELNGKGRMFAKITLPPGSSVGWHEHVGDSEAYYILRGQALVNDNGAEVELAAGDVVLTSDGESHSIANNGDQDLVFIALVLFA